MFYTLLTNDGKVDEADKILVEKTVTNHFNDYKEITTGNIGSLEFMNLLKMEQGLTMLAFEKFMQLKLNLDIVFKANLDRYKNIVNLVIHQVILPKTYGDVLDSTNVTRILDKLSKCNKNAFLGSYETIRFIASMLRKKLKLKLGNNFRFEQVTISTEPIMPAYETKVFFNIPADMRGDFKRNILSLSESGLENLWSNWADSWNKWNYTLEEARHEIPVKSASLYDSNVRVIFLLLLAVLLFPVSVFVIELVSLLSFKKFWYEVVKSWFHLKQKVVFSLKHL